MGGGRDVRDWDEDAYREGVLRERELHFRTVFRTAFAPSPDPGNPTALVAACSDGSVAAYSIAACIPSSHEKVPNHKLYQPSPYHIPFAKPLCYLQGHKGPAYDAKFYGEGEDSLLLSCGDDGRIYGWRWKEVVKSSFPSSIEESPQPVLEFVNSQDRGPWHALSAIPENNAIDVNTQQGVVFSATGDACAYCWDMETGQKIMIFQGHSDYLHCIVACKSSSQIITGSEDGTARLWESDRRMTAPLVSFELYIANILIKALPKKRYCFLFDKLCMSSVFALTCVLVLEIVELPNAFELCTLRARVSLGNPHGSALLLSIQMKVGWLVAQEIAYLFGVFLFASVFGVLIVMFPYKTHYLTIIRFWLLDRNLHSYDSISTVPFSPAYSVLLHLCFPSLNFLLG